MRLQTRRWVSSQHLPLDTIVRECWHRVHREGAHALNMATRGFSAFCHSPPAWVVASEKITSEPSGQEYETMFGESWFSIEDGVTKFALCEPCAPKQFVLRIIGATAVETTRKRCGNQFRTGRAGSKLEGRGGWVGGGPGRGWIPGRGQ